MDLSSVFYRSLETYGVLNILIPFILIFSLIYIILEASNMLKKDDNDNIGRKLHAAFAFGFALMAMAHQDVIRWIINFIPNVAIVILSIFLLVMAIALLVKPSELPGWFRGVIYLIVFLVIVSLAINSMSSGTVPGETSNLSNIILQIFTPDLVSILVTLGLFVALLWWLMKPSQQRT